MYIRSYVNESHARHGSTRKLNKKGSYGSIFKGIHKQPLNKRRRKKENRRESNERKRKRTESNEFMESVLETSDTDLDVEKGLTNIR